MFEQKKKYWDDEKRLVTGFLYQVESLVGSYFKVQAVNNEFFEGCHYGFVIDIAGKIFRVMLAEPFFISTNNSNENWTESGWFVITAKKLLVEKAGNPRVLY